jgi:hypothetical protein
MNQTTEDLAKLLRIRERYQLYSAYLRAGVRDSRFDNVDTCGWSAASWVSKQIDEQFEIFSRNSRSDEEFLVNLQNAWRNTFGYVPKLPRKNEYGLR